MHETMTTIAQTNQTPLDSITAVTDGVLGHVVLGNTVQAWIIASAMLLGLLLAVYIVRSWLLGRLAKIAARTSRSWDDIAIDILRKVKVWLIFPALVYAAAQSLLLSPALTSGLKIVAIVGIALQLVLSSLRLVDAGLALLVKNSRTESGEQDVTVASSLGVLRFIAITVIAIVVALLALDNMNVSITPMLTGLGVGGIAVALAVQNILGDLFGSLSIILDKPFVVGDFIVVGEQKGTVERIGVKTTRVRALSGEQLIFANSDLLNSRVQNFKRMQERRISFTIGVTYETPAEKLRAITGIIRSAIEKQPQVRVDRIHFKGFGAYSLDFETIYFVLSPEFNVYMNIQQAINLEIFERFAAEGIEFAYPTAVRIQRQEGPRVESAPAGVTPAQTASPAPRS